MGYGNFSKQVVAIIILIYLMELRQLLAKNMELLSDKCQHNKKHFNVFNLSVVDSKVYAEMGTRSKITQGFKIYVSIDLRLQNSKKFNNIITYDMDVCRALLSLRRNIYRKWFHSILKYGNFSDKCPVLPGYYYLKGWMLEDDLIPGFMFSGDYRIQLNGFYGRFKANAESVFMRCEFVIRLA